MTARLVVDAARCTGHGICALRCPDRIALDTWGYAKADPEPLTAHRELARARRAVGSCPEHALALEDLDGPPPRPGSGSSR